jgi:uncharacterized repeat protein (TIGR03803 family)
MHCTASMHRIFRASLTCLLCLAGTAVASAADSYNLATGELSLPTVVIGGATYSNMVVGIGAIISGPTGTTANGSVDSYDPRTNQLTIQTVTAGSNTYYNVIATVAAVVSSGGVTGADTYNGTSVSIPFVQVGGRIYNNVVATVASVVRVAGGMPAFATNTYDPATNHLAIPAVMDTLNNQAYTNVIVTVGSVSSVGGITSSISESILHPFSGTSGIAGTNDGAVPTSLILGSDGSLYGTTFPGGANQQGMVFKLSPLGVESILYSFTGNGGVAASIDGAGPTSLVQGSDGNLYGTTKAGGMYNEGTVFSITTGGVEAVIYSFSGHGGLPNSSDGALPVGLLEGSDHSFYGTTQLGGANNLGTAFNITTNGVEAVLYSFGGGPTGATSGTDGATPAAGLVQGSDGNFYGTTQTGGANNAGSVFSLTPAGVESVLYSFAGSPDGEAPDAALVQGNDGKFYGTTYLAGAYDGGTVFSVTPAGVETVIHSFSGGGHLTGSTDGANPSAALILGSDGNLYGTTRAGGPQFFGGTLFKLTRFGVETVLYSFNGLTDAGADGDTPTLGLVADGLGNLFGTTVGGGLYGDGVVFEATNAIATH